jgi:uncharacterized protein YecT (DUF1311 family)
MRWIDPVFSVFAQELILKRSGIVICWVLVSGPAFAQAPSELAAIDAKLDTCLAKADGVTPAVDACNEQAEISADAILKRVYGKWVAQLQHPANDEVADSAEILRRLIASERAWISFRDTSCSLESISMLGGTGEGNVYGHCLYVKTRQRVLDLLDIQGSR